MTKNNKLLKEIKKFIDLKINTILIKHNGSIKILDIDNLNNIYIKFIGNCNLCLNKKNTLNKIIFKKIKKKFKIIKKIILKNN